MKLEDAIKTGRPFKRPCFQQASFTTAEPWLMSKPVSGQIVFASTGNPWISRAEDVVASDWEIRELTKSDIWNAIVKLRRELTSAIENFRKQCGLDEAPEFKTEDIPF